MSDFDAERVAEHVRVRTRSGSTRLSAALCRVCESFPEAYARVEAALGPGNAELTRDAELRLLADLQRLARLKGQPL